MKTKHYYLLILSISLFGNNIAQVFMGYNSYVLFGEKASPSPTEIFFDRLGDLYPDIEIDNNAVRKDGAALMFHFNKSIQFRDKLCTLYKRQTTVFEFIQDSIVAAKARQINKTVKQGKYSSITFIMVGYDNNYTDAKTSLETLKSKILNKNKKTLVIELFWDGTDLKVPLDNFRYATATSYFVGLGLRQLISNLNCQNIFLISHSLGANIICETLFNQIDKVTNFTGVRKYLQNVYKRDKFKTPPPDKQITIALIAPAMPGVNTFSDFMKRSYPINLAKKDNYKVIIGFNINDEVLKKYIGVQEHFGSTTLGSFKSEVDSVVNMFKHDYLKSTIEIIDFSSAGRKHAINNYLHCSKYDELLEKIYE